MHLKRRLGHSDNRLREAKIKLKLDLLDEPGQVLAIFAAHIATPGIQLLLRHLLPPVDGVGAENHRLMDQVVPQFVPLHHATPTVHHYHSTITVVVVVDLQCIHLAGMLATRAVWENLVNAVPGGLSSHTTRV